MAVTFTTAPLVASGDDITSTQLAGMADAFNDRLRSGLGDPTWRIHYYWLGLFRQLRNPDASGFLWPAEHEFFTFYQQIDPSDALYPDAAAGEPEGVNTANPAGGFVFGRDAYDIWDESTRVTDPMEGGLPLDLYGSPVATVDDQWRLGKAQRGAYDPQTGAVASPAWTAARSHWAFQYSIYAKVGNSYGGFLPTPEVLGDCADGTLEFPPTKDYAYFFTSLNTALSDVTYPGSCPEVEGNVQAISRLPWAYYVYVWRSGALSLDIWSTKDYLEGPYTYGNSLHRTSGEQLSRALNAFIADFRGTDAERATNSWNSRAFDFQKFFESQYVLSPQIGYTDATGTSIEPVYPLYRITGKYVASGESLVHAQTGQTSRDWTSGTVCTGCLVKSTDLFGEATIEILNGSTVVSTVVLSDATPAVIVNFSNGLSAPSISVRMKTEAKFSSDTGGVEVEFTELYTYKPEIHDAYLVLRGAATRDGDNHDGSGIWNEYAKEIGQNLFSKHCILNVHGSVDIPYNEGQINKNSVFDAVRRLSACIRNIPRQNIVGYEVAGGKSILYINRFALGMSHSVPIDLLSEVGPSLTPVATVQQGRSYVVRVGEIVYGGETYATGATFTAGSGTTFSGSGEVYEVDGIKAEAPKDSFSNEWLLDIDFHVYHPSDSSIWKPSAYSDYFWSGNRCHFYSSQVDNDAELRWQFNYGGLLSLNPEAPSGYNYVSGTNSSPYVDPADKIKFYKSCRVYEPPMEIESAVLDSTNPDVVKLTLKTRLHHAATAPASISRDVSTWVDGFLAEDYRTAENGLRQYLYLLSTGTNCPFMLGDAGMTSAVASLSDNPFGACFPLIRLTRLIRKPYKDDNDTPQSSDSKLLHDDFKVLESYLRAMCEGYVDGMTTALSGCARTDANYCAVSKYALFDYSYENLMFDAGGWRWINILSPLERTDNPQGFGPLPNTKAMAGMWNQFAAALNKLTRVRLPIPLKFQTQYRTFQDVQLIASSASDGTDDGGCSTSSARASYWKGVPELATTLVSSTTWSDDTTVAVATGSGVDMTSCSGSLWPLNLQREQGDYRVIPFDTDIENAFPETFSDMLYTNLGCIACKVTFIGRAVGDLVTDGAESDCSGNTSFYPTGDGRYWKFTSEGDQTAECILLDTGTIECEPQGQQVYSIGRTAGGETCSGSMQNTITISPYVDETTYLSVPLV